MGNALATFGQGYTIYSAVVTTIFSVLLIVWGIWLLVRDGSCDGSDQVAVRNDRTTGVVLILLGLLFIIISWFWVWASQKSRTVAQIEGVAGVVDIAEDI